MAGPTTARRGEDEAAPAGPPPAAEKKRRRPSAGVLIISVLLGTLLACGVFWVLYGSPWVRVERVTASGTDVLTEDEVLRAAAVPVNAPLVSVDTEAVAARLRDKLPRIASVDVERSWPDGIGLKVTERKPEVLIEKGGKFTEVDVDGVRFATVDRAPKGVPLLELDVSSSPSLRRFPEARLRREAVRVAAGLPAAVHRDTRVIRIRSYDSITLELAGGRTVAWGSGERGEEKSRTLLALMKTARDAGHFDVSSPSAPAVSGS